MAPPSAGGSSALDYSFMRMRGTFSTQSLARQVLYVLALVSLLYLLVAVVILRSSLFASFVGLEQELVREDGRRVREALDAEIEELLRLNNEWSQWDDTYRYLRDGSPSYAETWLNAATLDSAEVDLMALLNPDGSPAWTLMRDDEGRRLDAVVLLEPLSRPGGPFRALRERSDQVAGLVAGPQALVLLSALAVLHSDGSGPPAGVLVMGRRLAKDLIGRLSERTGVAFDVHTATALPPAARPYWTPSRTTRRRCHRTIRRRPSSAIRPSAISGVDPWRCSRRGRRGG